MVVVVVVVPNVVRNSRMTTGDEHNCQLRAVASTCRHLPFTHTCTHTASADVCPPNANRYAACMQPQPPYAPSCRCHHLDAPQLWPLWRVNLCIMCASTSQGHPKCAAAAYTTPAHGAAWCRLPQHCFRTAVSEKVAAVEHMQGRNTRVWEQGL